MFILVCPLALSKLFLVAASSVSVFLFLPCLAGKRLRETVAVEILAELSLPFSGRHGIPPAAVKHFKCGLLLTMGRETGRHFIGSFQHDLKAVFGQSFYRITAATDDRSFLVLFLNNLLIAT